MHVRRFRNPSPPGSEPDQVLFAEMFWADLSSAGEGVWKLIVRLFSIVFDLRFVANVAAAYPGLRWARWLRFFVYAMSWIVCGPIAALTAVMLALLAARYAAVTLSASTTAGTALSPGGSWPSPRSRWTTRASRAAWARNLTQAGRSSPGKSSSLRSRESEL